ncbi:class 1 fructose-bisphosphatase [Aliarcobacter skirrowii]|uniref:Fructose-1,6-bisphosphatase class 1 n=1 Tax=Aliarcobacter skirrowii CCUG 10374 TaxID=1032239 RepID=A0AAD0SMH3_9BACT|nr:class 1 fructose-bisphosphatase [Aliarcobacter skirrowii]AXX84843.1 fructose-1,6-bisphosphatase I [Aliarcobacter skirrowii CCUG 10374]KAB0620420.1 class 1 fructose-bisphosphatase [Aliarcobacter skirrowii CCUG 10374]MDD2508812.1 class 1 fructose-bisphosphatase [Aliarcobacter skirrowii]MDD3497342.1 class 1 fructose-bisphosphatase [Aliarcobacter skirrowii]RXI25611.1 class 1 fructose-bisphosphatase [Aliarcobacter skirrowii CCUG 10374]
MQEIIKAIQEASIKIKYLIETGDTGKSQSENSTGDVQLKLDIQSDQIIEEIFSKVPNIKAIVSEEQDEILNLNKDGEYLIAYDPLDGSSLVDVNLSVGSIYGIYKNEFNAKNIVASVYVVFGPRVEMVVTTNDVKMYRLLNGEFKFIQNIKLNEKGKLNAPGSTQNCWAPFHKQLIDDIFNDGYRLRYSGGMVPDLHQILLKGGGLFSYPGTSDKPKGKLRQLFEVFPFALVYEKAGGAAVDGYKRVLEIETSHIHDTTPCFFGSQNEIKRVLEVYGKNV